MQWRWTSHPARRRPQDVFLLAAVVLLSAWAVLVTLQSPLLAALAVVVLMVSVSPFWLPTHYQLDDDGVEARRLWTKRRRSWVDLRRAQIGPGAALVSPFARPTWMDRHRGVMLYFDGLGPDSARAAVLSELRARFP